MKNQILLSRLAKISKLQSEKIDLSLISDLEQASTALLNASNEMIRSANSFAKNKDAALKSLQILDEDESQVDKANNAFVQAYSEYKRAAKEMGISVELAVAEKAMAARDEARKIKTSASTGRMI